jgi:hypothetical protein
MVSRYSTLIELAIKLNSLRIGFFIEPSLAIAYRPYHAKMPGGFKQKDNKWPKFTDELRLHLGFNF